MNNALKLKDITIVIVSYKSKNKVLNILKKTKNLCKFIIIENSEDINLKKEIIQSFNKNIRVILSKNIGYGNGVNLASKYVKTRYFLAFGPDINPLSLFDLNEFLFYAKKIKKFGALGPRYIKNRTNKNLTQTNKEKKFSKINCLSGAVLLFDKNVFKKLNGFDKNIFLFFEENDYSFRANKNHFYSYQINTIKVHHQHGKSVKTNNINEKNIIKLLTAWHYTWSKFYYFKKRYSYLLSIIYLLPLIIRCFAKKVYFGKNKNSYNYKKYNVRADAIITSLKNKPSYLREKDIIKGSFN